MAVTAMKETRSDRIFDVCNIAVLGLFLLAVLYPLVYILSASFSSAQAISSGQVWLWPVDFNLEGYKAIFEYKSIVAGFLNSVFYAVVGTLINVTMTLLAAYPLSRRDLYGRNGFMFLFVFTMLFSGGMIPTYLVVHQLGLLNTRWALILPTAMAVWNMIITRTYYQVTIPHELLEAARIDGCDDFKFFTRIVLPLSKPIIAVNALLYAVGHWNQFFNALIYLTDESLFPLQLVLREILVKNSIDPSQIQDAAELMRVQELRDLLKYSLIVIASVPPLLAYPFVQRHFVKGVMIGSLKG
ncbi:multiple sugar transport system permease protein/putative aldouronate transport system permease protein [Actinopolymorpha cephalotaxi]|uniref:Multiple sugar transport system permease protein/putative aldouronate transport system permease protein n=1 Tax=Actinopolymorpha cephalotaxi TaxID=504797 RepID=A0A1I3BLL9_9ACTN|nr:carbohydrate ABC transporter permease [Actinopolymorpha cephalotaxi]NYH82858.1 multiple sugar transport system permease protein/putative aldouronate transport system permease protein [Actinopolymorpha cephalotaxi]SFH63224.1 multiple sugar transport system permease protein/putative aldouronate transport system permease protein [Actinopolymorpha cephalotaxi]